MPEPIAIGQSFYSDSTDAEPQGKTSSAVELIDAWLTTKSTVLWGSSWDVTSPDRRRLAAEWFYEQITALLEHRMAERSSP